jgi:hypothetical protein
MKIRIILVLLIGGGALAAAMRPQKTQPLSTPPGVEKPRVSKPAPAWFKRHQELYGRIDHTRAARSNP